MRSVLLLLAACGPVREISPQNDRGADGARDGSTAGLLISEVMDEPSSRYKYVEVCNRTSGNIDLSGIHLERYANGNTSGSSVELTGVLASGEALVIASTNGNTDFTNDFGVSPTIESGVVSGNGDDVYALADDEGVLDVYGVIGTDGTGEPWEYTDQVVHRNEGVALGSASWSVDQWTVGTAGTPFDCGTPIVAEPTPVPPTIPPTPIQGTVLISEIMDHASQSQLKYVEICNRSGAPVSLAGYSLRRYGNGGTTPSDQPLDSVLLAPGAAFVIANSSGASDFRSVYGFDADQTSTTATGNGDDVYALALNGQLMDVYGVIGIDGTAQDWEYTDQSVTRTDTSYVGRSTYTPAEWILGGESAGTPGVCGAGVGDGGGDDGGGDDGGGDDGGDDGGGDDGGGDDGGGDDGGGDDGGGSDDCSDGDGDGFGDCIDCDDNNADVYPGAIEACDGLDSDCDGVILPGDGDFNNDGLLDCEICDEEGFWIRTQNVTGTALRNIIRTEGNATRCNYNSARANVFGDIDAFNGRVECVYTDASAPARFSSTTGSLNIEHTWPQSQGASSVPARCDMHHLFPTDMRANSTRSSHPFGDADPGTVTWSDGESKLGRLNGSIVFEVPDDHKGNVARSLFYMSAVYNFNFSSDYQARMRVWAANDPVDFKEMDRSQRIQAIQGGVNPLAVCPHLLDQL